MDQGKSTEWDQSKSEKVKTKLGLINFAFYTTVYFVFIFMCVLAPKLMATNVGDLNLAIVYGFGLIILAIVQALIYNYVCSKREKLEASEGKN
jgi:uncharacterized membrane protein (DUF485 family)